MVWESRKACGLLKNGGWPRVAGIPVQSSVQVVTGLEDVHSLFDKVAVRPHHIPFTHPVVAREKRYVVILCLFSREPHSRQHGGPQRWEVAVIALSLNEHGLVDAVERPHVKRGLCELTEFPKSDHWRDTYLGIKFPAQGANKCRVAELLLVLRNPLEIDIIFQVLSGRYKDRVQPVADKVAVVLLDIGVRTVIEV